MAGPLAQKYLRISVLPRIVANINLGIVLHEAFFSSSAILDVTSSFLEDIIYSFWMENKDMSKHFHDKFQRNNIFNYEACN